MIRLLYYLPKERMGIEYQRFDGKEYVSLKRYYNLLCKCKTLEEENKNLEEKVETLELWLDNKEKVNKSLREEIKDHQLYEEKLEHRIIEFEELLHGE